MLWFIPSPDAACATKLKQSLRILRLNLRFRFARGQYPRRPEAHQKFEEEIPVVFINGKKAFKYHLDERSPKKLKVNADNSQVRGAATAAPALRDQTGNASEPEY